MQMSETGTEQLEQFAIWADDHPENVVVFSALSVIDAIEQFACDGDVDGVTFYAFPVAQATVVRGEVKTKFIPIAPEA